MIPEAEKHRFEERGHLFLRWTRNFLFLTGFLAVSYVALTMLHAKLYQSAANNALDTQPDATNPPYPTAQLNASQPRTAPSEGDLMGRIEIPRLGMKVAILEGTTSQTLQLGVGHIGGTAFPGEPGNFGIAGHRDTYFRALKDIRAGDEIQVQTSTGLSTYQVDRLQIVAPSDVGVLAQSAQTAITLVTCYPFYYIGAAPRRFIVHAHIVRDST
jgi:sortase A